MTRNRDRRGKEKGHRGAFCRSPTPPLKPGQTQSFEDHVHVNKEHRFAWSLPRRGACQPQGIQGVKGLS